MASETVDPRSWTVHPELHVLHCVNAAYKSQDLLQRSNRGSNTRPRECQTPTQGFPISMSLPFPIAILNGTLFFRETTCSNGRLSLTSYNTNISYCLGFCNEAM